MCVALQTIKVLAFEQNKKPLGQPLSVLLSTYGIKNIHGLSSGEAALALLRDDHYDLIVSDLDAASLESNLFIRNLRRYPGPNPFVPIVIMSGRVGKPQAPPTYLAGVSELSARPRLPKELFFAYVKQILARPQHALPTGTYCGPERRQNARGDGKDNPATSIRTSDPEAVDPPIGHPFLL